MTNDISVVIPTIPTRAKKLRQALASVCVQTLPPAAIVVEYDHGHTGSAATRNRALEKVTTEFVAFLDDDDSMLPHHLERLMSESQSTGADVVYSLPQVIGPNGENLPRQFDFGGGPTFDPEYLRVKAHIQTTSLVRTEWAKKVGGFRFIQDATGAVNDDHGFYLSLLEAGARFAHVHEETFTWRHWGFGTADAPGNTSGDPTRWA